MKLYLFVRIVGGEDPNCNAVTPRACDDESSWKLICAGTPKQARTHAHYCVTDQPRVFDLGVANGRVEEGLICESDEDGNGAVMLQRLLKEIPGRLL